MTMSYVNHQYSVNYLQREPWSINSNNSDISGSLLEGDEELLVMDNTRLHLSEDYGEDFCRCINCSRGGAHISTISNGSFMQEVDHDFTLSGHVHNELEPSNPYQHFNYSATDSSLQHSWSDHCHPATDESNQSVKQAKRQLIIGCLLCLFFMLAEIIGGYIANSLAIMTDAAHLLSDLASFMLSLFAIWISQKSPSKNMNFGYYRAEVLGAVTSIFMIWVLTGILVYLAIDRVINRDYEINSDAMIIVSGCGVAMNIVMGLTLSGGICGNTNNNHGHSHGSSHGHGHSHGSHGHSHANMNVRAALIHVIGDLIQSVGVLIAAYIIHYNPQYKLADPICTFLFSTLVLFTTYNIMKDAVHVLMEGFPTSLDYSSIKDSLQQIQGVKMAHSLHIWSLTLDRNALSVHLAIDSRTDPEKILKSAEGLIRKKYEIKHTTIQVERYDPQTMLHCNTCKGP